MPSRSSYRQAEWNPYDILDIVDNKRCLGYPVKGNACGNEIAKHNRQNMNAILTRISLLDPEDVERRQLREIAGFGLCKRYHQGQVDRMVSQWSNALLD